MPGFDRAKADRGHGPRLDPEGQRFTDVAIDRTRMTSRRCASGAERQSRLLQPGDVFGRGLSYS